MSAAIFAFGVAILGFAGYGIVAPGGLKALLRNWNPRTRYAVAIGVRVAMGGILLLGADATPFPAPLRVLGWIALLAAAVLAFMGPGRVDSFFAWWGDKPDGFIRGWCLLGVAFGAFLVWAGLAPAG